MKYIIFLIVLYVIICSLRMAGSISVIDFIQIFVTIGLGFLLLELSQFYIFLFNRY